MDATDPLNRAQAAVSGALTKAFESGDTRLVLAAAAGAVLVGVAALAYEFGGAAIQAVGDGCEAAVEYVGAQVTSLLAPTKKAIVTEIKPGDIFPREPYPGLYPEL